MGESEEYFEQKFNENFTEEHCFAIRGLFDEAYYLRNAIYDNRDIPWLKMTSIGKLDLASHLLRAAIESTAYVFCRKGILPFQVITVPMNGKFLNHIEFKTPLGATLYVSRTYKAHEKPRDVNYRPVYQPNMFTDYVEGIITPRFLQQPITTFLATYGDAGENEFSFGDIGIPGEHAWLYRRPLGQGSYQILNKDEREEVLVQLTNQKEDGYSGENRA